MPKLRNPWLIGSILAVGLIVSLGGCASTPVDTSSYAEGPAPLQIQSPAREGDDCESYEDSLTGGKVFKMYCSYCHNAPSLAERPYAQFRNIAAHMRVRANLTGKEYAKLMEFLRRWNDVPPPNPPLNPSPKRLIFTQPINELRDQPPAKPGPAEDLPLPKPIPADVPPKKGPGPVELPPPGKPIPADVPPKKEPGPIELPPKNDPGSIQVLPPVKLGPVEAPPANGTGSVDTPPAK